MAGFFPRKSPADVVVQNASPFSFICFILLLLLFSEVAQGQNGGAGPGIEYIGTAPFLPMANYGPGNLGGSYQAAPRKVDWLKISYANNTIDGVTIEKADMQNYAVRADFQGFDDIYFELGTPMPTCRVDPTGQRIFCLSDTNSVEAGSSQGDRKPFCCGDHFTIFYRDGRMPSRLYIMEELRDAMTGTSLPSSVDMSPEEAVSISLGSVFELEYESGSKFAYAQDVPGSQGTLLTMLLTLEYHSDTLRDAGFQSTSDFAQVLLRFEENSNLDITKTWVMPHPSLATSAVLGLRDLGTMSLESSDQMWKIHYSNIVLEAPMARITGLARFYHPAYELKMITFCLKANSECITTRDSWAADITTNPILQRFGTPPIRDPDTGAHLGYRYFGLEPSTYNMPSTGLTGGAHGAWMVFYTAGGSITVTTMWNMEDSATMRSYGAEPRTFFSRILEVTITPFLNQSMVVPKSEDGILFSTTFRETILDMHIQTGGGARLLNCGMYLVSSGYSNLKINPFVGIAIWDPNGDNMKFKTNFTSDLGAPVWDPFIFFQPSNDPFPYWGQQMPNVQQ